MVEPEPDQSKDERKRPDENACTKDGSLDRHGKPAIKGRTGGWRCAVFILGKKQMKNRYTVCEV